MQLTKSFTLEQLTASATAKRLGLDNTPDAQILERLKILAGVLEHLQDILGLTLTVSSAYRAPAVNQAVGGVATSAHCKGYAVDLQSSVSPEVLATKVKGTGIKFDQMIVETAGAKRWLHFSIDPRFRGKYFRIDK